MAKPREHGRPWVGSWNGAVRCRDLSTPALALPRNGEGEKRGAPSYPSSPRQGEHHIVA